MYEPAVGTFARVVLLFNVPAEMTCPFISIIAYCLALLDLSVAIVISRAPDLSTWNDLLFVLMLRSAMAASLFIVNDAKIIWSEFILTIR